MSKLEELIEQYCTDGVEWKPLGEATIMKRGTSATKGIMQEGDIPVISGGRQPAFYCNVSNRTGEVITVAGSGAGAGYVQYWNEPIFVCDAFSIQGNETLKTKYVYYVLTNIQEKIYSTKKGGGVPHVHISSIDKFEIPVPPLPVQEEIVRVLDAFTELQAELQAELQKRLQQYNYYRDNLLSVYSDSNTVRILELQQCVSPDCSMSYGVVQPGEDFIGGIPVVRPVDLSGRIIHNKGIKTVKPILLKAYSRTELKGGELLVCVRGTTGVVAFAGEDLKGGNVTRGIVPLRFNPLVNSNYMYHLFNSRIVKKQIENKTQGAALQQINVGDLKKISIPIPPLAEQNRIVSILDRFDTLTNDLTSGLPAEIEKRRQQYEYYRDKLLTFKRKGA